MSKRNSVWTVLKQAVQENKFKFKVYFFEVKKVPYFLVYAGKLFLRGHPSDRGGVNVSTNLSTLGYPLMFYFNKTHICTLSGQVSGHVTSGIKQFRPSSGHVRGHVYFITCPANSRG